VKTFFCLALAAVVAAPVSAGGSRQVLAVHVFLTVKGKNVTVPFMMRDPEVRRTGWDSAMRETMEIPEAEAMLMPTDEPGRGDPKGGDTDFSTYAAAITIVNPVPTYELSIRPPRAGRLEATVTLFGYVDQPDAVFRKRVAANETVVLMYSAPQSPNGGRPRRPAMLEVQKKKTRRDEPPPGAPLN
jgi:hypothetical protein